MGKIQDSSQRCYLKDQLLTKTISPGYIETTMVTELFKNNPARKEVWSSHNPLGRISIPEEYRAATVFLAGSGSSFMTGYTSSFFQVTDTSADLRIDGGHCAW